MVKRVTVSVPDELYEKMKEWGESINFSKEFQRHMGTLIRQKEEIKNLVKGDKKMQEIVERLRKEKIEVMGDPTEKGFEDGYEWAKSAHLSSLRKALKWDPSRGYPDDEELKEYLDRIFCEDEDDEYEYLSREAWQRSQRHEYNDKYIDGFKKGIEAFWARAKELI